jgi:hypothetical protein
MLKPRKSLPLRRRVNSDPAPVLAEAVQVTRFWRSVAIGKDDECWLWQGSMNREYGEFFYGGRMRPAHELALSFSVGEVRPKGFDTCHSCDTPPCCNPHHLRFDTRQSNVDDMYERNRAPLGEAHPQAKLTNAIVREIRERRASGARQVDLATHYGVSSAYISDIVNGLVWQDAGGPITGKGKRTKRYKNSTRGKAA